MRHFALPRIGRRRNAQEYFVGEQQGERLLAGCRHTVEDNAKFILETV
jgi:hypothetical protein